jgi:tRNA(Phe) wybutosine-synthesizing methylase Tyw3
MSSVDTLGDDETQQPPDDDGRHDDSSKEEEPGPKRRRVGRPARTLDDLYDMEAPDGGRWDFVIEGEEKLAIYVCKHCFPPGRDARNNLGKQISGRIIGDLGTIVSKANDHCRKLEHISKKLQAERSKNQSLEDAYRRAEEEKKTAARLVLAFTRLAAVTGATLPTMFDSGALDEIVSEFPAGVRSMIRSITRCSGLLPKADTVRDKYMPAILSLDLTLLRELIRGRFYSLLIDESRDCVGRPVANVLCQLDLGGQATVFLIASKRLPGPANHANMKETMDSALSRIEGKWENVLCVASDSASYMVKMMKLLRAKHTNVLHVRCLAHLLHNAVEAGISKSEIISSAQEFAVNFVRTVRPAAMQALWAAEVQTRMLVRPNRVPKYYPTRWECLLDILRFALEYLPASVAFIRQILQPATDLHRKLQGTCAGSNESGVISLLKTKLLVAISELERMQTFLDTMQLQKTTFGTLTKGIAFLEDRLKESAAADQASISAAFPRELRTLMDPYIVVAADNAKMFRAAANRHFQASLGKHFYKDIRVAQLADCAQLLDPRLPTRQRVPWSLLEPAAKWWAAATSASAELIEAIRTEHTHYNRMDLESEAGVTDGLLFWHQRKDGALRHLAALACDLLALPISSAAVERSFSEQHRTDTKIASSTGPEYAEAKAILYQNRHMHRDPRPEFVQLCKLVFDTWYYGKLSSETGDVSRRQVLADLVHVDAFSCDEELRALTSTPFGDVEDPADALPFSPPATGANGASVAGQEGADEDDP